MTNVINCNFVVKSHCLTIFITLCQKLSRLRWKLYIACMEENRNVYKVLVQKMKTLTVCVCVCVTLLLLNHSVMNETCHGLYLSSKDLHTQMPIQIHLQKFISYIQVEGNIQHFNTCCITFVLFSTKCSSFHVFIFFSSNNTPVFHTPCAEI